eukprot:TRINITY_DN2116_c0_g1_i2.p1 TRINITY_DN2116_c0_g1~~TRINITY_DN2116_c0_g1_i2.p1  ORF type:complete len:518 (-),score=54.25 TRINITY_DN2116_c0_g1_i2:65-1618(-)
MSCFNSVGWLLLCVARVCCEPCYAWGQLQAFMSNTSSAMHQTDAVIERNKIRSMEIAKSHEKQKQAALPTKQSPTIPRPPGPNSCGANPCLPGISSMGIGLDAISGRLKSQPIVGFTYAQGNLWNNPFTNVNYAYPDQTVVVDSSSHELNTYVFSSTTEYANYLAWKAGLSGGIGSFFTGSFDVQSVSSIFSENLAKLGLTTQMASMYEVTLAPSFLLTYTDLFTQMANDLPEQYNEQAYSGFVNYFGTHMVTKALYGGEAVMKTAVDQHYFSMYDESYISAQLSIMYQEFQMGTNFWRNHTESFGEFLNASYSEVHLIGGNYADFNINDWDKWVESIGSAPVQVSYSVVEISTMLTDPTKQANLARYIGSYIQANNHTKPPVVAPPPMQSCDEHTSEYKLENCNVTKQLVFSFDQIYVENGTPYFQFPENCATPCYKATTTEAPVKRNGDQPRSVPQIEECDCYTESSDSSYCVQIQSFVSGYDGWFKDGWGGYYPVVPPLCCRPCYKTVIPAWNA